MTPRPVQGAGSFGLRISQYPSLFAADKEGTLPTGVLRSFDARTRGGGTEADNSFPVSLNPVQELVARPLRSLAVQAPRWRKNEAGVRVMTACLTQAEEVARTYRVPLGISMYWRSSLAALRSRRTSDVNTLHDFFVDDDFYCKVSDVARTEQAAASSIESFFSSFSASRIWPCEPPGELIQGMRRAWKLPLTLRVTA